MAEHMITTIDNPYNPVTEFNEWNAWDKQAGYHTLALLARITKTSDELSEPQQALAEELAVMEIARENVSGMHRAVSLDTGLPDSE